MKLREADETYFYCDYYDDGTPPTPKGLPKSAEALARAATADPKLTDRKCPQCASPARRTARRASIAESR